MICGFDFFFREISLLRLLCGRDVLQNVSTGKPIIPICKKTILVYNLIYNLLYLYLKSIHYEKYQSIRICCIRFSVKLKMKKMIQTLFLQFQPVLPKCNKIWKTSLVLDAMI